MIWGCFCNKRVADLYCVQAVHSLHGNQSMLKGHAIHSGQQLIAAKPPATNYFRTFSFPFHYEEATDMGRSMCSVGSIGSAG